MLRRETADDAPWGMDPRPENNFSAEGLSDNTPLGLEQRGGKGLAAGLEARFPLRVALDVGRPKGLEPGQTDGKTLETPRQ